MGLALNRDGDAKGARKAFETAVKLRPDDAVAHAGLAYVLLLADKTGDAAREAKRALEIDAQNADAHYITPATKDGQQVSEAVMLEYYFNLY